jgi:uncharacterized Tic20 family protein
MKVIAEIAGAIVLRALFVAPFALLFWWLRKSAKKLQPQEHDSTVDFFLSPRMRILIGVVLGLLVAFTVLTLVEISRQGGNFFALLIPLCVLAAIILATPHAVVIDHNGIRQGRWFLGDRVIAWNEIASMTRGRNTGTTYVKSRNGGRPISFSPLLVGQSRFEQEVRAHRCDIE